MDALLQELDNLRSSLLALQAVPRPKLPAANAPAWEEPEGSEPVTPTERTRRGGGGSRFGGSRNLTPLLRRLSETGEDLESLARCDEVKRPIAEWRLPPRSVNALSTLLKEAPALAADLAPALPATPATQVCAVMPLPSANAFCVSNIRRTSGCTMMGSAGPSGFLGPVRERMASRSLA